MSFQSKSKTKYRNSNSVGLLLMALLCVSLRPNSLLSLARSLDPQIEDLVHRIDNSLLEEEGELQLEAVLGSARPGQLRGMQAHYEREREEVTRRLEELMRGGVGEETTRRGDEENASEPVPGPVVGVSGKSEAAGGVDDISVDKIIDEALARSKKLDFVLTKIGEKLKETAALLEASVPTEDGTGEGVTKENEKKIEGQEKVEEEKEKDEPKTEVEEEMKKAKKEAEAAKAAAEEKKEATRKEEEASKAKAEYEMKKEMEEMSKKEAEVAEAKKAATKEEEAGADTSQVSQRRQMRERPEGRQQRVQ
eukprot:Nk52_evm7s533 gene=Nk52_evmTU7s533